MAKKVEIKLDGAGVRALLQSPEVLADMKRRAENVARQAGEGHEVRAYVGKDRARATVSAKSARARRNEAKYRALTRAIEAARR